jgi:hypothetical protein
MTTIGVSLYCLGLYSKDSILTDVDVEQNNHDSMSDDPTYALPSDVSFRPPYRCHDNEAYDEGNQSCGTESTQTEDIFILSLIKIQSL